MGLLAPWQKAALALTALALAFSFGGLSAWFWQDNKFTRELSEQAQQFNADINSINLAAGEAQRKADADYEQLSRVLSTTSRQLYEAYTNATQLATQYAADIAAGDERLSVPVTNCTHTPAKVPATPGAGSVVHGSYRADIDPRAATAIVALTNRGDAAIRMLQACQTYAREVSSEKRNN